MHVCGMPTNKICRNTSESLEMDLLRMHHRFVTSLCVRDVVAEGGCHAWGKCCVFEVASAGDCCGPACFSSRQRPSRRGVRGKLDRCGSEHGAGHGVHHA